MEKLAKKKTLPKPQFDNDIMNAVVEKKNGDFPTYEVVDYKTLDSAETLYAMDSYIKNYKNIVPYDLAFGTMLGGCCSLLATFWGNDWSSLAFIPVGAVIGGVVSGATYASYIGIRKVLRNKHKKLLIKAKNIENESEKEL